MSKELIKWKSIEQFRNVVYFANNYLKEVHSLENFPIMYRGKVKLHGTNAAINFSRETVYAQKRNHIVSFRDDKYPSDGHFGFTNFVAENFPDDVFALNNYHGITANNVIVYGEWCGKGIQKGVASSQVEQKFFAIFAVKFVYDEHVENVYDPKEIESIVFNLFGMHENDQIKIIPYHTETMEVYILNKQSCEEFAETLGKIVEEVETCDPFVKSEFDIEGIGEGLVMYPIQCDNHWDFALDIFMFKAKGEKHKVVKEKKVVEVDPVVVAKISEYVEFAVTENRLEQAYFETVGEEFPTMKNIGPFLKWVNQDLIKETSDVLENSGLTFKEVQSSVAKKAKEYFQSKL